MAKGQEFWGHFNTREYVPKTTIKRIKPLGSIEPITDPDHEMFQELRTYFKRSKIDYTLRYRPSSLESVLEFLQEPSENTLETIKFVLEKYQHQLK